MNKSGSSKIKSRNVKQKYKEQSTFHKYAVSLASQTAGKRRRKNKYQFLAPRKRSLAVGKKNTNVFYYNYYNSATIGPILNISIFAGSCIQALSCWKPTADCELTLTGTMVEDFIKPHHYYYIGRDIGVSQNVTKT